MQRIVLLGALFVMAAAPLVAAHEPNPNGNCGNIEDETVALGATTLATPVATAYVTVAPHVWAESNGVAGLQTHAHVCRMSSQSAPISVAPDTQLI